MRRSLRIALVVGLGIGVFWALRRTISLRRSTSGEPLTSEEPWPPIEPVDTPWVEPSDAVCPSSHPIKVKLASGIFHAPGMLAYQRTRPDRCYATEDAAAADGFIKAKR